MLIIINDLINGRWNKKYMVSVPRFLFFALILKISIPTLDYFSTKVINLKMNIYIGKISTLSSFNNNRKLALQTLNYYIHD